MQEQHDPFAWVSALANTYSGVSDGTRFGFEGYEVATNGCILIARKGVPDGIAPAPHSLAHAAKEFLSIEGEFYRVSGRDLAEWAGEPIQTLSKGGGYFCSECGEHNVIEPEYSPCRDGWLFGVPIDRRYAWIVSLLMSGDLDGEITVAVPVPGDGSPFVLRGYGWWSAIMPLRPADESAPRLGDPA